MTEINYAELERNLCYNPTDGQLKNLAETHIEYGWSPQPWGNWTPEQTKIYMDAYKDYKQQGIPLVV